MKKNRTRGLITMFLGVILVIAGLITMLIVKEANWLVGAFFGIAASDIFFGIIIFFQKTKAQIIDKYEAKRQKQAEKEGLDVPGPQVRYTASSDSQMNFDPDTGKPLNK